MPELKMPELKMPELKMPELKKKALRGELIVFTINETAFGWEEIAAAAQSWGEWQPFVNETRQALACLQYAAATNEPLPPRAVKEAVTAFRYAHNLISAEDAQAWLQHWSITQEEWMNALRAQLLREHWAGRLDAIVTAHPVSDAALAAALQPFAICADQLRAWAHKLAGRAALAASSAPHEAGGGSPHNLIARIEAGFDDAQQQAVTPQRLATNIANHRLDWIRFSCRYVWFAEERLAREAAFCVTEDGLSLDEVAYDAAAIVQQWDFYLDEIEAAARPHFLAARPGAWLGPVKMLAGFPLFAVEHKQMPNSDDPRIRQRAAQTILTGLLEQATNDREIGRAHV